MMGSGKTTLGRAVSERLGYVYIDSDDEIKHRHGVTARELAELNGVPFLHNIEAEMLLLGLHEKPPVVLSAAASVIENPQCREQLKRDALVCWIDVPVRVLAERIGLEPHRRPMSPEQIEMALARREPLFSEVSALRLDGCLPVGELVECVVQAIGGRVGSQRGQQ
jgi:shikimate kinase